MAQAYNLYAPPLEGPCPSVPRHLPPGPCGGGTGLDLTLVCSPGHSTPTLLRTDLTALPLSFHHPSTDVPLGLSLSMVSACLHIHVF